MKIPYSILALAAGLASGAAPVTAEESSVYITQINQSAPLAGSRRPAAADAYSRVLGNASTLANTRPIAAPDTLGIDLTTLNGDPNAVRSAVTAASAAGTGARGLTNNVALLNQFGTANIGAIEQTGFNNNAVTSVIGDRNVTSQTQRDGSGNQSVIGVTGSDNRVASGQSGSGNSANLSFFGSGYTINSQQTGTNLSYSLTSDALGGSGKTITVEQIGAGTARNLVPAALPAGLNPTISRR